ncbi:hypothetical protein, partial [Salmonella sp. s51228]|uniref:hypothetical protein n=1 Tax=Salmonella sp. s51228 TaxID=3159652 RepID=UPI00397E97E9
NLNGANDDVEIVFEEEDTILKNIEYGTLPAMVHGNGPSKHILDILGNYLAKSWTEGKGCLNCEDNKILLDAVSDEDLPHVTIGLFIEEPSAF